MTDTTTALDLDAIRRREQAADSGPWRVVEEPGRITIQTAIRYGESSEIAEMVSSDNFEPWASKLTEENAEFIAAARTDVPDLLAEVDRLRAQLDANAHEHHNRVTRLERYINGLETQCNTQMHELAAANEQIASMRAALDEADREQDADKIEPVAEKNLTDAAAAPTTDPEYLIWSHHHKAWWGPNGAGYRSQIGDAGRYTLADTKGWLGRGCGCCEVPEVPVPAERVFQVGVIVDLDRVIADATTAAIKAGDVNRYYAGGEVAR